MSKWTSGMSRFDLMWFNNPLCTDNDNLLSIPIGTAGMGETCIAIWNALGCVNQSSILTHYHS